MSLPSQFPAKVCLQRCSTCVFGPNSPISPERMRELADGWKGGNGHQICHHHGVGDEDGSRGEDVWCLGFWETQLTAIQRAMLVAAGYIVFVPPNPGEPR